MRRGTGYGWCLLWVFLVSRNLLEFVAMKRNEENPENGIMLSAPEMMGLMEAVHQKGASFRFQAKGFSMTPSIRDGDVITVSPLGGGKPRRGDVVAFRHLESPRMLVHRVLRKKRDRFLIKGDNCSDADGWIPGENILGVITRVERQGKNVFWPNRLYAWARFYFRLYIFWAPVRQLLAKGYHVLKK
jgi:signal peptidase I